MEKTNSKRHFTASALVFHKGKILLLEHKKLGSWLYPGGHIEPNETPDEAVYREVKEETGINVSIVDNRDMKLGDENVEVLHKPFAILCELIDTPNDRHYHIDMIYICKSDTDVIKVNKNETKNIGWFSHEDLQNLNLFPNFRVLLKKAFEYFNIKQYLDSTP